MTTAELIQRIALKQPHLSERDVEFAVKRMLDQMAECLAGGGRIEIRGFASYSLHYRPALPQPQDRNAGVGSREVRPVLQARQEAARTRRSRGGRGD